MTLARRSTCASRTAPKCEGSSGAAKRGALHLRELSGEELAGSRRSQHLRSRPVDPYPVIQHPWRGAQLRTLVM
jgi:hypothetical protein